MTSRRRAALVIGVSLFGPAVVVLAGRLHPLAGLVAFAAFAGWCGALLVARRIRTGREALERWRAGQATPLASYTPQTEDRWSAGEPGRGRWAV